MGSHHIEFVETPKNKAMFSYFKVGFTVSVAVLRSPGGDMDTKNRTIACSGRLSSFVVVVILPSSIVRGLHSLVSVMMAAFPMIVSIAVVQKVSFRLTLLLGCWGWIPLQD